MSTLQHRKLESWCCKTLVNQASFIGYLVKRSASGILQLDPASRWAVYSCYSDLFALSNLIAEHRGMPFSSQLETHSWSV